MYFLIYCTCFHIASILAASSTRYLYHVDNHPSGVSENSDFVLLSNHELRQLNSLVTDAGLNDDAFRFTNELASRPKRSSSVYREGGPNNTAIIHSEDTNTTRRNQTTDEATRLLPVPVTVSTTTTTTTTTTTITTNNNNNNGTVQTPSVPKKVVPVSQNASGVDSVVTVSPSVTSTSASSTATAGTASSSAPDVSAGTAVTIHNSSSNNNTRGYNESSGLAVESVTPQDNITIPNYARDFNDSVLKQYNISESYFDNHIYYNSTRFYDSAQVKSFWVDFDNTSLKHVNQLLSHSYRRASTIQLPFKFPFYGHDIENITIATGGFIYTGDFVHSWLAATQYIAPLMANFDTSLTNYSAVKCRGNETSFTVLWENVVLQDKPAAGNFTFEVTLLASGDIIFVYKEIPSITSNITDDYHPVKVGLSDAYILDRTVFYVRRKTIFEYHRIHFDKNDLKNWTMIYLKPQETCRNKTTCETCLAGDTIFKCQWCDNRCSTGIDRYRHGWLKKECDKRKITDIKQCATSPEQVPVPGAYKAIRDNDHDGKSSAGVVFLMLVLLGLVTCLLVWTFYAYKNPHSTSGQILIKYRPSQWSGWRKGEARYTAATIHM